MEMNEDSPTTTLLRQRRRQPPTSPIIYPVVVILLLPILTLLILFFLVPPFLSHTTQILCPNSVKKGWDSFNILLVVFAILCGVFSRLKNDDTTSPVVSSNDTQQPVSNDQWFEPEEEKSCNFDPVGLPETGVNRLRRSSSSYPDLRQVPPWETGDNQSRFYDDFGVNLYRPAAEYDGHRPLRRRSFHTVPRKKNEVQVLDVNEKQETSPPLLPTELSPPVEKQQKLQRRKSGTKELATAIASLYNQSNRKRRTKKRDIFYSVANSPPSAEQVLPPPTPPPPPPPPPLPPSKVFQNLFKKNRKSKRVHSDPSNVPSPPPPPPPPQPPNSIFNNLFKSKRYFHHTASSTRPPPPPAPPPQAHVSSRRRRSPPHSQPPRQRSSSSRKSPFPRQHYYDDNLNSRSQSPLIPMPPPPPPPPFKMREMNFFSSPEIEDVDVIDDVSVRSSSEAMDGEDLTGPSVTCPSPDVNVKAATFIARLRDEWRLEKMNSFRERVHWAEGPGPM